MEMGIRTHCEFTYKAMTPEDLLYVMSHPDSNLCLLQSALEAQSTGNHQIAPYSQRLEFLPLQPNTGDSYILSIIIAIEMSIEYLANFLTCGKTRVNAVTSCRFRCSSDLLPKIETIILNFNECTESD